MTFPVLSANGPSGYNLTRSLRFRSSASAYLNRTPASATNQKTWTWSGWVKLGSLSSTPVLLCQYTDGVNQTQIQLRAGGGGNDYQIRFYDLTASTFTSNVYWSPLFRDPSSWYHFVFVADTTQATDTNRLKLYVNGVQVTSTTSATWPAQNTNLRINLAAPHFINANGAGPTYESYLAEVNFIDGQALTPSSFGSTNSTTGVWQPAKYTGTYGTNGFYLPFTDNSALTTSSNAGLGKDFSGNANYWVTNNISLTTGVTYDSMTDVPTLTSATAANFAVLNPLDKLSAVTAPSNGNLRYTTANTFGLIRGTIGATSGKWYYETTITAVPSGGSMYIGVKDSLNTSMDSSNGLGSNSGTTNEFGYAQSGYKQNNGTATNIGTTLGVGDVLMVAYDLNGGYIWWGKNGTWISSGNPATGANPMFSTLTSSNGYSPSTGYNSSYTDGIADFNFGQRPFSYTPPSGFVALNAYNLPASSIPNGASYMAATTYTGNGGTLAVANTVGSTSFQPDWVWVKSRSTTQNNYSIDSVRGINNILVQNNTNNEAYYDATWRGLYGNLSAINSNGFTVVDGTDPTFDSFNGSGVTYIGWQWKAGGTAVSNTNGSITSSVSANTTSGCSVVTWTSPASGVPTIGHGLGVAPTFIIVKDRTTAYNWDVGCDSIGWANRLNLNTTNVAYAGYWNSTAPTSSVFTYTAAGANSGDLMVAYCFTPIKGFSAFGSYTGNGSTDGPFVYLGFRPRYLMLKITTTGGYYWMIKDSSRDPYNTTSHELYANVVDTEYTASGYALDFLSNGFKIKSAGQALNGSGDTYIYMAFAESPFQNSLAR